jgi:hypothetical protein
MTVALSLPESALMTVLGNFIVSLMDPAVVVVQGQDNRVPAPIAANYVVMTPLHRKRLATNVSTWDNSTPSPTLLAVAEAVEETIQIDTHGTLAADNAQVIAGMLRDPYACDFFTQQGFDIQPLYASDPMQAPFINGEDQYEDRWIVHAVMHANQVMSIPQQFADAIDLTLLEVDTTYPPH